MKHGNYFRLHFFLQRIMTYSILKLLREKNNGTTIGKVGTSLFPRHQAPARWMTVNV